MKYAFILLLTLPIQAFALDLDVDLKNEIKTLKYELVKQNQRIKKLETLVMPASGSKQKAVLVDRFAWQKSGNWDRVKRGMSRQQVEAILGQPTGTSEPYYGQPIVRLYYKGNTSSSGYISGYVEMNMDDNRVKYVEEPVI